jgi:hypothetical protein
MAEKYGKGIDINDVYLCDNDSYRKITRKELEDRLESWKIELARTQQTTRTPPLDK